MNTAVKVTGADTRAEVAHSGAKGVALPAVPVLQQIPKEEDDMPVQQIAVVRKETRLTTPVLPSILPTQKPFVAQAKQKAPAAAYMPFIATTPLQKEPSDSPGRFTLTPQQDAGTPLTGAVQLQAFNSNQQPVVQMVKASALVSIGKQWNKEIWINADDSKKKEMIAKIEKDTGLKSGTVFQKYDLYIRGAGPSAYKDIVKLMEKKDATTFLKFLNDEIEFEDMDVKLAKLAVIVCVSETGRGYAVDEMRGFMEKIIAGEVNWSGIKDNYAPSLTYKEDAFGKAGEYRPGMDESEDHSEASSEEDEAISDDEATEMTDESSKATATGATRSGKSFY
jgi:hypothetical protein